MIVKYAQHSSRDPAGYSAVEPMCLDSRSKAQTGPDTAALALRPLLSEFREYALQQGQGTPSKGRSPNMGLKLVVNAEVVIQGHLDSCRIVVACDEIVNAAHGTPRKSYIPACSPASQFFAVSRATEG